MIYGYFMGFMMYYKLKLIRRVIIQPDPFLKILELIVGRLNLKSEIPDPNFNGYMNVYA